MENADTPETVKPAEAAATDTQDRLKAARDFACAQYDKLCRATAEQMENVRKYTGEAREQINAGWDVTCAKAKDLHQAGEEYVKANPTGTILGALGVGFVLGLLIGVTRR